LAEANKAGWFGKVVKRDGRGTSNIGVFGGKHGKPAGSATNVVTDYVYLKGEARSPKAEFATRIALGFNDAFEDAKLKVKDASGATADVKFHHTQGYPPFNLDKESAVVQHATMAITSLGLTPTYVFSNGGLDKLARQARHSDGHNRRGPKRNPRGGRVCRPSGVPAGLSSGDRPRDAR
jgi:tripeptide aminopeptidase